MRVTQAVLPYMRQQGGGSIVNISSFGGVVALPFDSLYNSSKFAVEGFSESLSHEVASFNIRVKLVEPGSVATVFRSNLEMIPNLLPDYNSIMGSFFQRYSGITDHLAKASVSDVANTIYQACTDESPQLRYVVGNDAQFYIDLKRGNNDDAFITQMRQYFFNNYLNTTMKTIFITGASSGLGKATTKLFAEKGWKVLATMRHPEDATDLATIDNIHLLQLDVTDRLSIKTAIEAAIQISPVDVVFNNAGYGLTGPLEGYTDGQITRQFDTNVLV